MMKQEETEDPFVNPVCEFFREKLGEYWGHIKNVINYAYVKRLEEAQGLFTGGLAQKMYTVPIEIEKHDLFSNILPKIEELFTEGLDKWEREQRLVTNQQT